MTGKRDCRSMRFDDVTSVSHASRKQSGRVKQQDKLEMGRIRTTIERKHPGME